MIKKFNEYNEYVRDKYNIKDIIECIENGGYILSNIIKGDLNNNSNEPLKPVSIDEYGDILVEYKNEIKTIKLKNVLKIIY